ncbi:hypothetical protein OROGR_032212 [Orobanche gracilis]
MALLALPTVTAAAAPYWKTAVLGKRLIFSPDYSFKIASIAKARRFEPVRAFFPNPNQEAILKEALREPVAFMGGILAGLLKLDLNEEPLKEWVSRTVEASGISAEELGNGDVEEEDEMPQQIEIE